MFLDHLLGVERLLQEWKLPEAVALAGLFHSVYGTDSFSRPLLRRHDRERVRALIGEQAERLAYLYGGMKADSFLTSAPKDPPHEIQMRWQPEPMIVDPQDMRALAAIFAANWLEQFPRMRGKARASRMDRLRSLASWLGGAPAAAIDDAYGFGRPPLEIKRAALRADAADQDRIEVWDDAVPAELKVRLAGLVDLNIWRYGWKASPEQSSFGFWHSHFGGDDAASSQNCEHDLLGRPLIKPVLDLWRMLEAGPLEGQVPVRVYANGHTYGGDGFLHRDQSEPGHFTTIYYAHQTWEPNWAGETVFFNKEQDDILRAVYPKPGRIVHFPGYIMHAARSPGRDCPALRAVIVLKSRLKRPGE